MSAFTTRVELHHASEADYATLHHQMEAAGFYRVIQGGNGVWYHLPLAEYVCHSGTIEGVREAAQRAAAATGRNNAVFVSETTQWAWAGLTPVRNLVRQ